MKRSLSYLGVLLMLAGCGTAEFHSVNSGLFLGSKDAANRQSQDLAAGYDDDYGANDGDEDAATDDEQKTCMDGVMPELNFETPPPGVSDGDQVNLAITDQFAATHGVRFSASPGQQPIIRRTSREGEAQPPREEQAWQCILCPGWPSRNRLVNAEAEATVGRFVLSSTAAAQNASGWLRVDYLVPVSELSFDLVDVDGTEVWVVEAFDRNGQIIPELTQSVRYRAFDYRTGRTGNGAPTRVEISSPDGKASVMGFVIRGEKWIDRFGFAFDNFKPGIPDCTP